MVEVGDRQAGRVQWAAHEVTPSSHFLEYIPGRDQLWTPEALRAGSPSSMLWLCYAVLCCVVLCVVGCTDANFEVQTHYMVSQTPAVTEKVELVAIEQK